MLHSSIPDLWSSLEGVVEKGGNGKLTIRNPQKLRSEATDRLVHTAVFAPESEVRQEARRIIGGIADGTGLVLSSIRPLYDARGRGECGGFTVPAINVRGMTYDFARAIFRAALRGDVGAFLFEIARTEIAYTDQRPSEYVAAILAAGIREGFTGPVFVQGDHFQVKASAFEKDPEKELRAVSELIREAVGAGFYNIDIDTSTLVDLSQPTIDEQQRRNFENSAILTEAVRKAEPGGISVSLGGEIGEVGGKNSTVEELVAYMDGYNRVLATRGLEGEGISKISVQTGTTHGGVPLPDGSIADVALDLDTLAKLSEVSRAKYGMGGAVQHGASTLPDEAFGHFPRTETCEVHLATAFQNQVYDHPALPDDLRQKVYEHLKKANASEWKEEMTEQQFLYKTRKKGWGPFKKEFWNIPASAREEIGKDLEERFHFLFGVLQVSGTRPLVEEKVKPVVVAREV